MCYSLSKGPRQLSANQERFNDFRAPLFENTIYCSVVNFPNNRVAFNQVKWRLSLDCPCCAGSCGQRWLFQPSSHPDSALTFSRPVHASTSQMNNCSPEGCLKRAWALLSQTKILHWNHCEDNLEVVISESVEGESGHLMFSNSVKLKHSFW